MLLRRELVLAIGSLVGLNLLLAFGVIGLLVRMGPATERILEENVTSIVAAEEILAQYASAGEQALDAEARSRVRGAVDRAKRSVTDEEERAVVATIERTVLRPGPLPAAARRDAVDAVRGLIDINRDAMMWGGREAQRLGLAGAWACVFIGFVSFLLSLVILAVLRRRFVVPVLELHDVLERVSRGDRHRRCRTLSAPMELRDVAVALNALLDIDLAPLEPSEREDADQDLEVLQLLLERQEGAAVMVDARGAILHANGAAIDALAGERGDALHAALESPQTYAREGATPIRAFPAESGRVFLCLLSP